MKENEELSFPEAVLSSSFPKGSGAEEERETASASLRSVHFLFLIFGWWTGTGLEPKGIVFPSLPTKDKI